MASTPTVPLLSARSHLLIPAVVGILIVAIVSALVDLGVTATATQAVGPQFRFQIVGILFASTSQFAVMLALIAAIGTLGGHRLAVRGASIAAIVFGVLLIILLPFYTLDFIQSRRLVPQNNLKGFTLAGEKTGLFAGFFALVLLWAGVRAFQASRRADEAEKRIKGQDLVVGQK